MRVGQCFRNRLQHPRMIAEHIMIPEPEYLIPALHEDGCPFLIGSDPTSMVATIQFDHQPVGWTAEIHNVGADGVLSAKLDVMELPVLQLPPKYPLAVGLPSAKPSGQSTVHAPLTLPSPHRGEGSFVVREASYVNRQRENVKSKR